MELHTAEALVLDVMDLHDYDRILTFLTRWQGKKRGVARGARRKYSRFGGQLQPLAKVSVTWHEKAGRDLGRISSVEMIRAAESLQQDLEGLLLSAYLRDHMLEFAQEDEPENHLYRLLDSTLEALLESRRYDGAIEAFGMAAHLDPKEGEDAAHLGYALHLAQPHDELVMREALEHIARGIKQTPDRWKPLVYLGRVFVAAGERDNARKAKRALAKLSARFKDGLSVCLFPEGTRSPDGTVQRYKRGPFLTAVQDGVPVLPVALIGTSTILPKKKLSPRAGRIDVVIGEPIPTVGMTIRDTKKLARDVEAWTREQVGQNLPRN